MQGRTRSRQPRAAPGLDQPMGPPDGVRRGPRMAGPCRWAALGLLVLSVCGCTTLDDYIHNGFKVGPNYTPPSAPVAKHWIDADDARVRSEEVDDSRWWGVFGDPTLNELVQAAYQQNLTLREAGFRVLQARAQLGITIGEFFPQTQVTNGGYLRKGLSGNVANRGAISQRWFNQWNYGFGVAWELDFWGRFRRAIESSEATLDASVDNYDAVLVTLIGDVAASYVRVRTVQQQLAYARQTLGLQRQSLEIATAKFKGGQTSEVDVNQGQSDVSTTEALVEELLIDLRRETNRLCVLLGLPPEDLVRKLGDAPIPTAPPEVAVGIPADLIRRRPDVRRAERQAAAPSAQIGVAEAAFLPQISIDTTFGWSSQDFGNLLDDRSFRGNFGPSFQWQILNYGRILNNVRLQDARFQELVVNYQNTLLLAGEEVENGLVTFLRAHNRARELTKAVNAEMAAFKEAVAQYKGGLVNYNRVVVIQERLVSRQQTLAEAQGEIAQGLIQVYRALGGGWQIRCDPEGLVLPPPLLPDQPPAKEPKPAPVPIKPPPEVKPAGGAR